MQNLCTQHFDLYIPERDDRACAYLGSLAQLQPTIDGNDALGNQRFAGAAAVA